MTDGAARTLLDSGNAALVERAVPRLTSRDPERFWTSGPDDRADRRVRRRREPHPRRADGRRLGTVRPKVVHLGRIGTDGADPGPPGQQPGGAGAAWRCSTWRQRGATRQHPIDRLKDKLGTAADGRADPRRHARRAGDRLTDGTRRIEPMLRITRVWNSVCATAAMRRALALATTSQVDDPWSIPLRAQPLHRETLADLATAYASAFSLTFALADLVGRAEAGELDDAGRHLLRLLLPITKLVTGKQAVAVVSEAVEAFGGAGYIEDTGLPTLLDTVLPDLGRHHQRARPRRPAAHRPG